MTTTTREAELTNARAELAKAWAAYNAAKKRGWTAKTRDAAESVEFWGNKVSFLAFVKACEKV